MRTCGLSCLILFTGGALSAQNTYYLPHVADGVVASGSLRSTIVLANPSKTAAAVTIAVTRDDATARTLTIPGLGTNSRFSAQLPPGATRLFTTDGSGDGTAGAAVVTSNTPVSVSEILSNADSTGSPVSESSATAVEDSGLALEYLIPVDATAGFDTGVSLYNPGKVAATVTLKLLDSTGQPAGSTNLTVAPQGHVARFVATDLFPGIGDFRGSLDVASAAKLAAIAVRRNGAQQTYTLSSAVSSLSRRLRFFLPQISDGPTDSGTLQTGFLLTNISTKPASVTLSLTGDDGSPLAVNIPGIDANGVVTGTIAPGATMLWQSDGASANLTSGAAAIRSTQPLAVAAAIRTLDDTGAILSETTVAPAPADFQVVLPFDNGSSTLAGATFWNTGAQPVALTLTLTDADGKVVTTVQPAPLAGGARLTGMISGLFPGVSATNGAIVASTPSLADGSLCALAIRNTLTGDALSSAPAVRVSWTPSGTPRTVTATLDTTRQATASIAPSGGSLSVTDAKGNRFTLTIPSGALLNRETITMTAISSATGLSAPGLVAGVQLEPDGLGLYQPALLKIELASPAPAGAMPVGWRGQAAGVYLNPPLRDPNSLTLTLTHFSGAGTGGFDLTSDLINIANLQDAYQSAAAYLIGRARQEALSGMEDTGTAEALSALFDQYYDDVILPMMELAQGSDDEDVMRCASTLVLGFERQRQLLGVADDSAGDGADETINSWLQYIMQRLLQKVGDRCKNHDVTAYFDAIAAERQALLMGISSSLPDISSCPPALQLDFTSEINGTVTTGIGGTFDATVSAKKVMLPGSLTKDVLTQIVDPAKDLYTSFIVSGSGPETYDSLTLMVNNVPSGCSVTVASKVPATLTVKAGQDPQLSQIQYKFNPNYQPQALTAAGQQLCISVPSIKRRR